MSSPRNLPGVEYELHAACLARSPLEALHLGCRGPQKGWETMRTELDGVEFPIMSYLTTLESWSLGGKLQRPNRVVVLTVSGQKH